MINKILIIDINLFLNERFMSNNLISTFLFEFTAKSNITVSCLELTVYISPYVAKRQKVTYIFTDMCKAFHTVDRFLLNKTFIKQE